MDLIQQFIDTYKMKWTFYDAAGRLAAEKLQLALQNAGIRAIVTSRAKNPARLRTKVQRRNSRREEPYQTIEEIYDDIADLSGVRVSLYFPGDRGKVDAIISELFNILEFKQFPEQSKPPTYHKRFSGYWANHYRARMRDEILNESQKKYESARIEIQVASLIMHAWSEVEHDLIYKPMQGTLSEEELSILDELNGLVLAGEIALERLQAAGNERLRSRNAAFGSQYELASYLYNFLSSHLKTEDIELRMGNIALLYRLCSVYSSLVSKILPRFCGLSNLKRIGAPFPSRSSIRLSPAMKSATSATRSCGRNRRPPHRKPCRQSTSSSRSGYH